VTSKHKKAITAAQRPPEHLIDEPGLFSRDVLRRRLIASCDWWVWLVAEHH
jgi:hypothetical protein